MSVFSVLAAIAIVAFVISQQVVGRAVTGRRLLVLPAVLTVIGIADLSSRGSHPTGVDITLIAASSLVAIGIGIALGTLTRLERRNGHLWAQLPTRGLWLWAGLIVSRVTVAGIAHADGAHVAAGTSTILLVLGLNRLAQAAVVAPRAISAGIPFAPEKDGRVFAGQWFGIVPAERD